MKKVERASSTWLSSSSQPSSPVSSKYIQHRRRKKPTYIRVSSSSSAAASTLQQNLPHNPEKRTKAPKTGERNFFRLPLIFATSSSLCVFIFLSVRKSVLKYVFIYTYKYIYIYIYKKNIRVYKAQLSVSLLLCVRFCVMCVHKNYM